MMGWMILLRKSENRMVEDAPPLINGLVELDCCCPFFALLQYVSMVGETRIQ